MDSSHRFTDTDSFCCENCRELQTKIYGLAGTLEDQSRMGMLAAMVSLVCGYALGVITMAVLGWMR